MGSTPRNPIIVIDDDEPVRSSTRALLEAQGYEVCDFSSAEEFLNAVGAEDAACLVLDLNLPGMSGVDLVEHLRDKGVQTPVIIVTANGNHMMVRAARAGVAAILRKPYAANALIAWLDKIISKIS